MNYTFEIEKASATQNFMRVRYDAEGLPSIRKAFNPNDFSQANLRALIESRAGSVIAEWERIQSLTGEVTEADLVETTGTAEYVSPPTPTNPPSFDPFTEKLEEGVDAATNTQNWTVVPKTQAERDEYLAEWRANTQCSMRQARLALAGAGLLSAVDTAIAGLPEEARNVVSIEWEYASVVDRDSPWMGDMAAALGMTDEQLDDLFKIALTL